MEDYERINGMEQSNKCVIEMRKTKGSFWDGKKLPVPSEVRIGGSLDWEVDDAANSALLQDSSVACSVASSQRLQLNAMAQRNGAFQGKITPRQHHRRRHHRHHGC